MTNKFDLALFDLDNTLLSGDSDFEWAQFLIGKGLLDRELLEAKNLEFLRAYQAGTLDILAFLDFQLQPLSRHSRTELDRWHLEFMAARIRPMIGAAAKALIGKHAGALTAIVTATNSFVTGPIAHEFGIPHLIATVPEQDAASGQYSGKPRGLPAFREGKIARVETWLESMGLWWGSFAHSYFYSDSHNDLPLMKLVSNPVAVDPDDILRANAADMGWPVISLR